MLLDWFILNVVHHSLLLMRLDRAFDKSLTVIARKALGRDLESW
jgi:hypothetical protein